MTAVVALPRRFATLVKIEHTIFALPFAYIGALLCIRRIPSGHDLVWITLAMLGARSLAMGLNRVIDAEIDARNPRTADRELPAGRLSHVQVTAFCVLALALYLVACFQLDPIVRWLWPIPIIPLLRNPECYCRAPDRTASCSSDRAGLSERAQTSSSSRKYF